LGAGLETLLARKILEDAAGKICKIVLPIKHEYYFGNGKELAICTLSSIGLIEEISRSKIMERIAIVGRLLSENKGIDQIIKFTIEHPELKVILLCGHEVIGHKAGQALLSLHKNGVDDRNRIIGARPRPHNTIRL
jgi:tetrahydromethanopterin S-methyltransferase subunit A